MGFKVGVTTGLYYIAHDISLASTVKKIGYSLTRGANIIEISGDTPHEISLSEGKEMRNIANNQGLTYFFHGSLTVPMAMPERTDWRDAQDHMEKSTRSAVNSGCKYVLFHACLHFWVELMTYTGTKLTITMSDHAGRFISEILYENKKLRNWFVKNLRVLGDIPYDQYILSEEDYYDAQGRAHAQLRTWEQAEVTRRTKKYAEAAQAMEDEAQRKHSPELMRKAQELGKEHDRQYKRISQEVAEESGRDEAVLRRKYMDDMVRRKLARKTQNDRRWRIDTYGRLVDAYKIMAHHLFFTKDPQWMSMAKVYEKVLKRLKINYSDDDWLMNAWNQAEMDNDTEFKEFFYAVVGAKFLEGHLAALIDWIDNKYIPIELKDKPDLQEIARKMMITIEIPDARDPKYAGRYMLSHPKQIYSAVKTSREVIKTDRIWMTIDNEHFATQGYDPWVEGKILSEKYPEFGKMVLSVHCSHPTPLHSHYPIELGDTSVYELLWYLRLTGAGKAQDTYLIFERGGGDDPFKTSVDSLKLMAEYLQKDVPPEKLDLRFYGLDKTGFDEKRQEQIMMDHRHDVLKDLFEVPEEDWGLISSAAAKKGKKEIFKKEEMK